MQRSLLAFVLLVSTSVSLAADLTLTATTVPPPPWSVTQPVELRLTFTNHASEARRGSFELWDFNRSAGLVHRLNISGGSESGLDDTVAPPYCADIGPTLDFLTWCATTVPIPPGESLVLVYDVVAFPDAVGFRDATFEMSPMTVDTVQQVPGAALVRAPVRFAYGFLPDVAVPGLGALGALLLGLGLLLAASWRMYGATPSKGLKS